MKSSLKPCPLCGKKPKRQKIAVLPPDQISFQVICSGRDKANRWHVVMVEADTRKDADTFWNKRSKT